MELPTEPDDSTVVSAGSVERDSISHLDGDDLKTEEMDSASSGCDGHQPGTSVVSSTKDVAVKEEVLQDEAMSETETVQNPEDLTGEARAPVSPTARPRPTPKPPPRTSRRVRRPPEWQRSGDFVMNQTTAQNWDDKSKLIEQLASAGIFGQIGEAMSQLIVNILHSSE